MLHSIKNMLHNFVWKYGTCDSRLARRHRWSGRVQFKAVSKGELTEVGRFKDSAVVYPSDYWVDFDPTWWKDFK